MNMTLLTKISVFKRQFLQNKLSILNFFWSIKNFLENLKIVWF